jgi:hypothetical protein
MTSEAIEREPAPEREASERLRERLLDFAGPALVLGAYAIGQLKFLEGPQPFDPARYWHTATDFPDL